ncbi:hypothetical protein FB451DRAFT_1396343 [Mycena latifolia]|nr:hypothetical protein FB451DRAFT_1396343 [Mycena latifolia]
MTVIDGVKREEGKLFFATVRLTYRRDPVHLRPGRISVRALHGRPGARALFLRFFPALAPVALNTGEAKVDSTNPNSAPLPRRNPKRAVPPPPHRRTEILPRPQTRPSALSPWQ